MGAEDGVSIASGFPDRSCEGWMIEDMKCMLLSKVIETYFYDTLWWILVSTS